MSDIELPEDYDWESVTAQGSPKTPFDLLADKKFVDLATPDVAVGGPAYDFKSRIYDYSDGTEKTTGLDFHLFTETKEKPVALIFGSYT